MIFRQSNCLSNRKLSPVKLKYMRYILVKTFIFYKIYNMIPELSENDMKMFLPIFRQSNRLF